MARRKGRNTKRTQRQVSKTEIQETPWVDEKPTSERRRVTLLADHTLTYPDLYLSVYIEGDRYEEAAFAQVFARAICTKANTPEEADLVVFTGGPDVDPALYGEIPHSTTQISPSRDTDDINTYMKCLSNGIPMVGICRGAQFLHVMNGGKLFQHVDGHYGDHQLFDNMTKELIQKVSSVHHQSIIRPAPTNKNFMLVATAIGAKCKSRWKNPDEEVKGAILDVEAFFYRDTLCFGIQGHPEYSGYNYFAKWMLDKINELYMLNPDVDWLGSRRRLNPDLLAQRDQIITQTVKETN